MMAAWHGMLILGLLLAGGSLLFLRMNRIMPDQPKEAPIYTLEGMTDYIEHTLQTADMLQLPVPKAHFHNVAVPQVNFKKTW